MSLVANLALLYAGLLVVNVALSAALWARSRDVLHRALALVWVSTLVSFAIQGIATWNDLAVAYGFTSVFAVNLALAVLVARLLDVGLRWRPFVALLLAAMALSAALYARGLGFTPVALPIALAVSLPVLAVAGRALRGWRRLTITTRALLASCILFSLHNVDFAFLRHRPEMAPLGLTIAVLIVFALSITAPAVVLERVTERQARIDAELEVARHIQSRLLPVDVRPPGFDVVSYMRSAESVGGDYFDVHAAPGGCWFLLGDVTGHGLGAGLVTLMAQSTMTSILETRPDVSPRELNFFANRVLATNLARLGEQRHMTFVALRGSGAGAFAVSGSHDTMYVVRAASGAVEQVALTHFPLGLGFRPELGPEAFAEEQLRLAAGDLLFLGSDGITEAARGGDYARGLFGEDALVDLLRASAGLSLEAMKRRLVAVLEEFTGGVYHDDVSFVIVRTLDSGAGAA